MADSKQNPVEGVADQVERKLEGVIEAEKAPEKTVQSPSLAEVLTSLQKATGKAAEPESLPLVVAGVEIPDTNVALKNIEEALSLLPECVKPKPDDVFFTSLPGNKVGESTAEGTKIDPIMLLHPAHRLAHVIAHETAHRNNTVPAEGLVEAWLRAIGVVETGKDGEVKTTEKYDKALALFYKFIENISEGRDKNAIIIEIYNLYYNGEYEKMFQMYNGMLDQGLSEKEKDNAVELFWDVFPELEYEDTGKTQGKALEVFHPAKPTFNVNTAFKKEDKLPSSS